MAKVAHDNVLDALLNVDDEPITAVHMERFGVDFKVKALAIKDIKRLQQQATFPVGKKEVLDEEYFMALAVAEACVVPNWNDPALAKKYGTGDVTEIVKKRLLAGEQAKLIQEIMTASGFDSGAAVAHAKN